MIRKNSLEKHFSTKKHRINPAAGCLPLIVQMTLLITLYRVIMNSSYDHTISVDPNHLYSFVAFPQTIDPLLSASCHLLSPIFFSHHYSCSTILPDENDATKTSPEEKSTQKARDR